ncbi:hypothetical protein P9D43_25405 [Neobacillus niacini]|uniref:hypothetical protein n=1 Tax=Neobacillus niacini TaxID=86668 RepID=UPI0007AB7CAC|nr:hypothetical protein [Neobacillus niacini]MEC1525339.1 hypothetical protein [Neobacillus niacini]
MLYVKVKAKDVRLTIPVPYALLTIFNSILSSKFVHQQANKWTREHFEKRKLDFSIPQLNKEMLKPIIKELKHHKGIVLVDVKAKDGTEVKVTL